MGYAIMNETTRNIPNITFTLIVFSLVNSVNVRPIKWIAVYTLSTCKPYMTYKCEKINENKH